ncbi:TetR/AcrR family transcriptional regulator [Alicyclobacillus sp. ALC3]|nr:TetR/AcrR family transcriptional regulator [Alicyclobacillus sp. ALC3]
MNERDRSHTRIERRDAIENRQRILHAALRLFDQHGVEKVSMNQIAAEAQVGPGTLYRRYGDKSELCLDLIKDNVDLLFEDIASYLKRNNDEPPSRRLEEVIRFFIRFRESKAQLLAGVEDSAMPLTKRHSLRTQSPIYNELHQLFVQLFSEMSVADPNHPDSVFRADMLLTALNRESYTFLREVRGFTPEAVLEQICLTFIKSAEPFD